MKTNTEKKSSVEEASFNDLYYYRDLSEAREAYIECKTFETEEKLRI